ncbi:hypothetical protein D3C87_1542970 [compost metagenome]
MLGFWSVISDCPCAKVPPTATICFVTMPSTGVVTRFTGLFTTARSEDRVNTGGNITERTTQMMKATIP